MRKLWGENSQGSDADAAASGPLAAYKDLPHVLEKRQTPTSSILKKSKGRVSEPDANSERRNVAFGFPEKKWPGWAPFIGARMERGHERTMVARAR